MSSKPSLITKPPLIDLIITDQVDLAAMQFSAHPEGTLDAGFRRYGGVGHLVPGKNSKGISAQSLYRYK